MRSWNIKKQLLILFLTVSIIPVIVVSISSYRSYTTLVNNHVSSVAMNTIDNSIGRINGIVQNIDRITTTFQQFSARPGSITVAEQLNELNRKSDLDLYDLFLARQNMMFFFDNILLSNSYINGIYIFMPNGHTISYSKRYDLAVNYNATRDEWYRKTVQEQGGLYISEIGKKDFIINSKNSITFSRALFDADTRQLLAVLMLDCDIAIFKELDKDIVPGVTNLYLVNNQGTIIYENSMKLIGQHLYKIPENKIDLSIDLSADETIQKQSSGLLTVVRPFPEYDWKIVAFIHIQELHKQFGISEKLIIYISLTCAVIFFALSFVLSKLFTKPIIELAHTMRSTKSYPLAPANKHFNRQDEIGILYREYNKMIRALEDYIRESYQNKLITLDAQMKALEAQINSHFLYNTLEAINSIAEIEEVESIAIMTKALGDMFRYSIKTESELVSVSEELNHVHNYIAIQKIRHEGKMKFDVCIEENILNMRILKLILQPVVENAIYHGIEKSKTGGVIELSAHEDNEMIIFEVKDNGVGMTSEQLHEIQSLLEEPAEFKELGQRNKRGIGLKNIHSRIELYYGSGYGLDIQSEKDAGTSVKIVIPKIG